MSILKHLRHIPVQLTLSQFNEFILKHLPKLKRGPFCKISLFKVFNYILKFLHTGCQWMTLSIDIAKQVHLFIFIHLFLLIRPLRLYLERVNKRKK